MRSKRKTTESFIQQVIEKHGFKYDYSLVDYKGCSEKIKIICKEHGEFTQKAFQHLFGAGCQLCANSPLLRRSTTEIFIKKAQLKHLNFYSYEKVNYIHAKEFVIITCPVHGDFNQRPNYHLSGNGCTLCYKENNNFGKSKFLHSCRKTNLGILYIIECFSKEESFVKIGITSQKIEQRFKRFNRFPYNYNIIYQKIDTAENIFNLEKKLHRFFKEDKYIPKALFRGSTECFNIKIKDYDFTRNEIIT